MTCAQVLRGAQLGALLLLSTAPAAAAPWLAPNPCVFTAGNVTWDLTPLYNGGLGYGYSDPLRFFRYRFEVCGDVDPILPPPCPVPSAGCTLDQAPSETYCNPNYLPRGYTRTGAILQFIDNTSAAPTTCPVPANDFLCISGNCVLLADGAKTPRVQPLDPLDPGSGVTWSITSPPYNGPFECKGGGGRTVIIQVLCDPSGLLGAPALVSNLTESPECTYTLSFPHKRGCGTVSSASATPSPSTSPEPPSSPYASRTPPSSLSASGTPPGSPSASSTPPGSPSASRTPPSSPSASRMPSPTPSRTPRPSCWPHLAPERDHCRCRHWDGEATEPGLASDGALCDAAAPNATCPRPRPTCHPDLLGGGSSSSGSSSEAALGGGVHPAQEAPGSSALLAACIALGVLLAAALALAALAGRRVALLAAVKSSRGGQQAAPAEPTVAVLNPLR